MSGLVVCDSSTIVAALLDGGSDGQWAANTLAGAHLAAPDLLPFEAANIIRRHELAKLISREQAAQAHADLLDLAVERWPYDVLAARAWELRRNLTAYDACYAALAELLDAPLATLDHRLRRAPGLRCTVVTP